MKKDEKQKVKDKNNQHEFYFSTPTKKKSIFQNHNSEKVNNSSKKHGYFSRTTFENISN